MRVSIKHNEICFLMANVLIQHLIDFLIAVIITEGANLPQRLLKVVRSDVGEPLQFAVRPLQLGRVARLFTFRPLALADVAKKERQ